MKKLSAFIVLGGLLSASVGRADDLKQSKFTQVVNSVEVVAAADQSQHTAAVNDVFKMPDLLKTGPNSRAEMVADDKTITRIGANTIFSFDPAARTIGLKQGSILFHAPHGKGGGTVHTASATASVLGTTIIVVATSDGGFKVITLEGEAKIQLPDGSTQVLHPGELIFVLPGGGTSPVIVFNLGDLVDGSLLVNGFTDQLPSMDLINAEIARQLAKILKHQYEDIGPLAPGGGDNTDGGRPISDAVNVQGDIVNKENRIFIGDIIIGGGLGIQPAG